jgi:hypothetical protein
MDYIHFIICANCGRANSKQCKDKQTEGYIISCDGCDEDNIICRFEGCNKVFGPKYGRKKKSKSQTDREKREKQEQAQHEIGDMLHANVEQTDYCPCNGGELFFIQHEKSDEERHKLKEKRFSNREKRKWKNNQSKRQPTIHR